MEVEHFPRLNKEITTSSVTDDAFVNRDLEILVVIVCVVALALIIIIVWLGYKLFDCSNFSSSSRTSSQSSLYSNVSDSPYQWRTLSYLVPADDSGSLHKFKQNKYIQRLLDSKSDLKQEDSNSEAVIVAPQSIV